MSGRSELLASSYPLQKWTLVGSSLSAGYTQHRLQTYCTLRQCIWVPLFPIKSQILLLSIFLEFVLCICIIHECRFLSYLNLKSHVGDLWTLLGTLQYALRLRKNRKVRSLRVLKKTASSSRSCSSWVRYGKTIHFEDVKHIHQVMPMYLSRSLSRIWEMNRLSST